MTAQAEVGLEKTPCLCTAGLLLEMVIYLHAFLKHFCSVHSFSKLFSHNCFNNGCHPSMYPVYVMAQEREIEGIYFADDN